MKEKHSLPRSISDSKESHITAALANIEKEDVESNVATPNKLLVEKAKDWVDNNQK